MKEAELISAFATLGQSFVAGLQASFTIVSAYIVALYFFLGRAPLLMKCIAFAFFTGTMLVLGLVMLGAINYADGIAIALGQERVGAGLSTVGEVVIAMMDHPLAYALLGTAIVIGAPTYLTLFYLTFFYRWRSAETNG
jgi:multisubunit Na+/H+ antiporter MnhC subunit